MLPDGGLSDISLRHQRKVSVMISKTFAPARQQTFNLHKLAGRAPQMVLPLKLLPNATGKGWYMKGYDPLHSITP